MPESRQADPLRLPYRPCVGICLLNPDDQVFVGRRIDTLVEAWQMPQGGIDPGETPLAAALRELREETSIAPEQVEVIAESPGWIAYDLPAELVPRVWGGRFRGQRQKWFLMRFLGHDDEIRIDTAHPEFTDWRWLPHEELLARIVPFKRATYARVLESFAPHLG